MTELNPTAAALLGFLAGGELSGYELAKAADEIIGDFWHVTRSQVYRELSALSERGLAAPAAPGRGPGSRTGSPRRAGRRSPSGWSDSR